VEPQFYAKPTSVFGYYRGAPYDGFTPAKEGAGQVSNSNVFAAGTTNANGTWTPTILYMFVLIFVEMFVFALIAKRI
jgi:hypothetical protein